MGWADSPDVTRHIDPAGSGRHEYAQHGSVENTANYTVFAMFFTAYPGLSALAKRQQDGQHSDHRRIRDVRRILNSIVQGETDTITGRYRTLARQRRIGSLQGVGKLKIDEMEGGKVGHTIGRPLGIFQIPHTVGGGGGR